MLEAAKCLTTLYTSNIGLNILVACLPRCKIYDRLHFVCM
jgi:hypothetical protein